MDTAIGILQTSETPVGVIISDQRMPGKTGVDLLTHARKAHPGTVRILATAYADIDSAIDAVNSGAIYRYIAKPWDIRELRGVLLRAMEFFIVQRERDLLFREKLHVVQRLIITDRVRSLMVLAAGLSHHIRNSMTALKTFLDLAPDKLRDEIKAAALQSPDFWADFWSVAQQESQRILTMVESVAGAMVDPPQSFTAGVGLPTILRHSMGQVKPHERFAAPHGQEKQEAISIDLPGHLPEIKADPAKLESMFKILLEKAQRLSGPASRLRIKASAGHTLWGAPAIQVTVASDAAAWDQAVVASLFTAFVPSREDPRDIGIELLSAFFIAHHHNGDIAIRPAAPDGPGFAVLLPLNPESVNRPSLEEHCLEKLFTKFDVWDSLADGE